jgi:hypothetical protein
MTGLIPILSATENPEKDLGGRWFVAIQASSFHYSNIPSFHLDIESAQTAISDLALRTRFFKTEKNCADCQQLMADGSIPKTCFPGCPSQGPPRRWRERRFSPPAHPGWFG